MQPSSFAVDPAGLLQAVGAACALYIASIGGWRWLTYEARWVGWETGAVSGRRIHVD